MKAVRVHAASVNPVDGMIAAGYLQSYFSAPLTLRSDFAGEVVTAGAGVQQCKSGDRVYGTSPALGTFAQLAGLIDAGKLKVFVNRTFPLAATPAAEAYKAADGAPGKVVIKVN